MDKTSEVYRAAVAAQAEVAERAFRMQGRSIMDRHQHEDTIRERHRPVDISDATWNEALREADVEVERKVRY